MSGLEGKLSREEKIERVRELAGQGKTAREISEEIGESRNYVYRIAENNEIQLTKRKGGWPRSRKRLVKLKPKIDEMAIEQGLTLEEMGEADNTSGENIRQYLHRRGIHELWLKRRAELTTEYRRNYYDGKQMLREAQGQFLSIVIARAEQLAREKGLAYEKAVQYMNAREVVHRDSISFDRLYNFFKRYENAKKRGKKINLSRLGRKSGFGASAIKRICSKIGIDPGHKKRIQIVEDNEKFEAVKRGLPTKFSNPDIAYFLALPEHLPGVRYGAMGIKRRSKSKLIGRLYMENDREYLTYRKASEIYEADDAGFTNEETMELVGVSRDILDYALYCKESFKGDIIRNLRVLYDMKDVKKPYVTSEMREKLKKEDERFRKSKR